jgi:hypothetical protein
MIKIEKRRIDSASGFFRTARWKVAALPWTLEHLRETAGELVFPVATNGEFIDLS